MVFLAACSFALMLSHVPECLRVPAPGDQALISACVSPYIAIREYLPWFLLFFCKDMTEGYQPCNTHKSLFDSWLCSPWSV
jgi:hypothetical protein